jgi:peptidoglycan/xylan/chitin deacetylase (PgdA/CDA1 family)
MIDPWETSVSEVHFKAHLAVLKNEYEVMPLESRSLEDAPARRRRKKIFITFDDGYLDNYERAVPLLKALDFPATFFIPTQILHGGSYFWWELVDYLFWEQESLPATITKIAGESPSIQAWSAEMMRRDPQAEKAWSANHQLPPTDRCRFYLQLCEWIKKQPSNDQQAIAHLLMDMCPAEKMTGFKKMQAGQIRQISREGFAIGAHTIHHPALGHQSYAVQTDEIRGCKKDLESLIGREIRTMAYPHGHFNADTIALTREAGYQCACTTEEGFLHRKSDPLALPRIWVKDVDGISFKRNLDHIFMS